jgi:hypothetical protein
MKQILVVILCLSQTGCFFAAHQIYKAINGNSDEKSSADKGSIVKVSGDPSGVVYQVTGTANPDPTANKFCGTFDKSAQQSHAVLASDNSYTTYYYDCR